MNLIRKSSWLTPGKWKAGLLGTEDDEGEKAEYQSPGEGHTRGCPRELSDVLSRMGLVLIRGLGDLSEMNHNPEERKEREGQQDQRWIKMSGASQASIPHRLTNSQALCRHQVSIIPAGNLGSIDQRKVHRGALLILSLIVLLEFWFSYLNGSYFKSLKEFQNTYVHLIY